MSDLQKLFEARAALEREKKALEDSYSKEQQILQAAIKARSKALKLLETETREQLQGSYQAGNPLPAGASIRNVKILEYDPEVMTAYCYLNPGYGLKYLTLDIKKFEADMKKEPLAGVTLKTEPQITIARDLTSYYKPVECACRECEDTGICQYCSGDAPFDPLIRKQHKDCPNCLNSGLCPECEPCENCNGDRMCPNCAGDGAQK